MDRFIKGYDLYKKIYSDFYDTFCLSKFCVFIRISSAVIILFSVIANMMNISLETFSFQLWDDSFRLYLTSDIALWVGLIWIAYRLALSLLCKYFWAWLEVKKDRLYMQIQFVIDDVVELVASGYFLLFACNFIIEDCNSVLHDTSWVEQIAICYLICVFISKSYNDNLVHWKKNQAEKSGYVDSNGNEIRQGSTVAYQRKLYFIKKHRVSGVDSNQERWSLEPLHHTGESIDFYKAVEDADGSLQIVNVYGSK